MIRFISATILISLYSVICFSQEYRDSAVWNKIEESIITKSFLTATRNKIEQLKPGIRKSKDYPSLARFYYYQMLIDDLRTEDTLYFKNSAFIDSLLEDKTTPVAFKTFLHVMQAKRLAEFNTRDLRFDRERYKTFTKAKLDAMSKYHFEEAKKTAGINKYLSEDVLWLSADPLSFVFNPALTDIIMAEQIRYSEHNRFDSFDETEVEHWMKLSPDSFIATISSFPDDRKYRYSSLPLYAEWCNYHRNEKPLFYSIEQMARTYIYRKYEYRNDKYDEIHKSYSAYLEQQLNSRWKEVKLLTIPEVCELWALKGMNYAPPGDNSYFYHWNTDYQFYPAKALQLYEENEKLFYNHPRLNKRMPEIKEDILSKELKWQMKDENVPDAPMLVKLTYKNVPRVYWRLVRTNMNEKLPDTNDAAIDYILSKKTVREGDDTLPLPPDHNRHKTLLKIDPLPAGEYYLLFADHPVRAGGPTISYQRFIVTTIALLRDAGRIYVLDRKTGKPLEGAEVVSDYRESKNAGWLPKKYTVSRQGYFDLTEEGIYFNRVYYKGDTLTNSFTVSDDDLPDEVYDKEEYDNLTEFYSEHAEVEIFTDRSIYRPGQKVYYKAIFVTRNPKTGLPLIMNKQNMGERYLKAWLKEDHPLLNVTNPFDRIIDSFQVKPDEYGAMSGSFIIPATAATGEWRIEPDEINAGRNNRGEFKVEEYKRPTYELTVDKPVKAYTLKDTIVFTVHAKSFAGARLNNMEISYSVRLNNTDLIDTTGYTDDKGELAIKVYDTLQAVTMNDTSNERVTLRYEMHAAATDATGESHTVNQGLTISSRPVNIVLKLNESYYVKDFSPVLITAKDANGVALSKELSVSVHRLSAGTGRSEFSLFSDQYLYPREDLLRWFPEIKSFSDNVKADEQLIYTTTIHTGNYEKLRFPEELLTPAEYSMSIICKENGKITGQQQRNFTIFDTKPSSLPDNKTSFYHLPVSTVNAGDTLVLYSGSSYDSTYVLQQVKYYSSKGETIHPVSFIIEENKTTGISAWKWKVPEDAVNEVLFTQLFIVNNTVYRNTKQVKISAWKDAPQIIIEKFRRELTPGAATEFSVSVKTKNINVAAELMSVMYDASLDRIEEHNWIIPEKRFSGWLDNKWPQSVSRYASGNLVFPKAPKERQPVFGPLLALQGRVPGLYISEAANLNNIAVIGYGTTTKRMTTGSVMTLKSNAITLQEIIRFTGDTKPLIIIDGVPFQGELAAVKISEITDAVLLRDADATAIYGSKGANGVLLLSTRGPIVLPELKLEQPVKVRSNFNETAFFFPAVHADKEGYYHFPFVIPESTTEWNWKLFAHTKNAAFAGTERKLITHLPLMVQPNMPRLLYQGDKMVLQTRISNLDSLDMKGTISCKAEDEVTGEDLTASVIAAPVNTFSVNKNANTSTPFVLTVPPSLLHPLRITITAQTGNFADAEEHIIPVLSKKSLLKESLSFQFLKADTTLHIPAAAGEPYGISLSMRPVPYAAIINALPFLSGYSFNCAEQTFNKLLAHAMALKIMKDDKDMQELFLQIREKVEKDTVKELPASPWLNLSNNTKKQQKELFALLDETESERKIKMHLQRLYALQNTDGGLAWFDGGNSNRYISEYVLTGFGKLLDDNLYIFSKDYQYDDFIKKLIKYCDNSFDKDATENYIIARSYWKAKYPLPAGYRDKMNIYLEKQWQTAGTRSLAAKARLITATLRSDAAGLQKKAEEELESLRQLAITDAQGLRWKDIADADDMGTNSEETMALLADAFEGEKFNGVRSGILQWLLNTQTGHHWQTTKATAAAIRLLDTEKETVSGTAQTVNALIDNSSVTVSNDLLSGNLYAFVNKSAIPAGISLNKETEGIAKGELTAYYFRDWNQITTAGTNVQLTREFLYDQPLKVGDTVKVVLHITSDKALRYVYLEDKRAAAFEPADGSSGNTSSDGLHFYRSVRDDGSRFFIDFIPSGEHTITYEQVVVNEGDFSCGPAVMECMYRPDIHANSSFQQITTIKQ